MNSSIDSDVAASFRKTFDEVVGQRKTALSDQSVHDTALPLTIEIRDSRFSRPKEQAIRTVGTAAGISFLVFLFQSGAPLVLTFVPLPYDKSTISVNFPDDPDKARKWHNVHLSSIAYGTREARVRRHAQQFKKMLSKLLHQVEISGDGNRLSNDSAGNVPTRLPQKM